MPSNRSQQPTTKRKNNMAIVIMQKFPCSEKGRKIFNDILRAEDGVKKTRTFDGLISAEILFDDESKWCSRNQRLGISCSFCGIYEISHYLGNCRKTCAVVDRGPRNHVSHLYWHLIVNSSEKNTQQPTTWGDPGCHDERERRINPCQETHPWAWNGSWNPAARVQDFG